MSEDLGALVAKLAADMTDLKKGLAEGRKELTSFENMAKDVAGTIKKALAFGGISLGFGKLFSDFLSSFKEVTNTESALLKMATRLNTTTEALSGLGYVAQKSGMEAESFNKSVERMQKNVSAAALGNEQASSTIDEMGESSAKGAGALRELGLNAQILNQLPISQKLIEIARAMKENIAPADRARIALDLFGKAGGAMVTVFAAGPDAIQGWIDKMERLGGVITTDMARAATDAKTAAGDLQTAWHSFALTLTDLVAPAITTALKGLTDLLLESRKVRQETNFVTEAFTKGTPALKEFANAFIEAIPKISTFIKALLLIPPFTFIFGPLAALVKAGEKPQESAGPWGEAVEPSYGAPSTPPGLRQPPSREKPGKGGGGAAADDHLLRPLLAMLKAQRDAELAAAQNSLDLLKTTNDKKRAELEKSLAEGLIDGQTYYARLQELQQQETAAALAMIAKKKEAQQKSYQDSLKELEADAKLSPEAKNLAQQKIAAENRKSVAKLDTEAAQARLEGEVKITNELKRQVEIRKEYGRKAEDLNLETAELLGAISEQEAKLQKLFLEWQRAKEDAFKAGAPAEYFRALEVNYQAKAFDASPLGQKIKDVGSILNNGLSDFVDTLWKGGVKISVALDQLGQKVMQDTFKLLVNDLGKALTQGLKNMVAQIANSLQGGGGGGFFSGAGNWLSGLFASEGPSQGLLNTWGNLIGIESAHGDAFRNGVRLAFAHGGIVTRPTLFPMADGAGLMGEAGAEGILPLTRVGGDLGVKAQMTPAAPLQITIEHHSQNPMKGSVKQDGQGNLRIILDEMVSQTVNASGLTSKALDQRYKATPPPLVRG